VNCSVATLHADRKIPGGTACFAHPHPIGTYGAVRNQHIDIATACLGSRKSSGKAGRRSGLSSWIVRALARDLDFTGHGGS
jgi:hypothetical protein